MGHCLEDIGVARLTALSPTGFAGVNRAVRDISAQALGLTPLPAEDVVPNMTTALAEFAEQFAVDVSAVTDAQRAALFTEFGTGSGHVVALTLIADFLPRVRAGLGALGIEDWPEPTDWDRDSDPSVVLLQKFLTAVGGLSALDPITTEVVRLRGAAQHQCRLCKSLRETTALNAGGSESLYGDIAGFEESTHLGDPHKAALRYVDALIWTPAHIPAEVVSGVREHFSAEQAVELTLDVMRNGCNKIAVSLAADAPRVAEGTELYQLMPDGRVILPG
ncbi:MAG: carboxymuconolactone decarboxylase family protein [Mycobacterium sp.]